MQMAKYLFTNARILMNDTPLSERSTVVDTDVFR